MLYVQRQCMRYAAPADRVAYEEAPAATARPVPAGGEDYAYPINRQTLDSGQFDKPVAVVANVHIPHVWERYEGGFFPGVLSPAVVARGYLVPYRAVIFLHERTSPAGHRRLVCIRYFPDWDAFRNTMLSGYSLEPIVVIPATLTSPPKLAQQPDFIGALNTSARTPMNVRVFAGQPDANDASHFTIRYQMWGQEDVWDGTLKDDDTVVLKPRNTPDDKK